MHFAAKHLISMTCLAIALTAVPAEARKRDDRRSDLAALDVKSLSNAGRTALSAGDSAAAIQALTELVARQPLDSTNQTLLAMAWDFRGSSDAEASAMAMAGYDLAARAEPGQFWPSALAGRAAFDQSKYAIALEHFSRAALLQPNDPRIVASVAASAYLAGDATLAFSAIERAISATQTPSDDLLRMGAILAVGAGASAEPYLKRLQPAEAKRLQPRLSQLAATTVLDEATRKDGPIEGPLGETPKQISLDVAILLSQNTQQSRTGFNLLDGLSLQYGGSFNNNQQRNVVDGGLPSTSSQRVITYSISVPQLNYNLNLFNRGGQQYSVVARPQLTAFLGEESEFFVGRSIKVAVGGVNTSTLEQVDIGVGLKVTPIEITPEGTKVRIDVGRSFLTADPAGSFREALTTFRQKVVATAVIRFGQTLLLSGLSETTSDKTFSKTPVLGDIPLIGLAFNDRNELKREDSVMVLVTPAMPMAMAGQPFARSEHAARLAKLWTENIDPASNAGAVAVSLDRMVRFSRMLRSDVAMVFPDAKQALPEFLAHAGN